MFLRGNMKRINIYVLILLFLPGVVFAEEIGSISDVGAKLRIGLKDYIQTVVEKNESIHSQEQEFLISRENIRREYSVFEPELINSFQRNQEKIKYSQEDKTSLLFSSESDKLIDSGNLMIQGKIPTGADVRLGYSQTASRDRAYDEDWEYKSYMGIEITQPLLKNAGMAPTAGIQVARKDADISFQSYRLKLIEVVFSAAASCWDYFSAREKLKIRRDSAEIAEKILAENKERVRLGKMAKTELMEAEAGLAKRKSWESSARQAHLAAMNTMRSYISSSDTDTALDIDFGSTFKGPKIDPDFAGSMKIALELRPEYLSALEKVEKEKILIRYAKNQRWPQLDLNGSYGLNGLAGTLSNSLEDAYNSDYRSWKVGLTLTVPLMGNIKSNSEMMAARHRKKQALLELRSIEVQIANIIHTAVKNVHASREQVAYYKNVRELEERLLEIEMEKLRRGKSNSRSVLEKEDDLHYAREAELESIVNERKSFLSLAVARGSVLRQNDIQVIRGKDGSAKIICQDKRGADQ